MAELEEIKEFQTPSGNARHLRAICSGFKTLCDPKTNGTKQFSFVLMTFSIFANIIVYYLLYYVVVYLHIKIYFLDIVSSKE